MNRLLKCVDLLEKLPVAVIAKNAISKEYVYWNSKAEELFGIKANEAVGHRDDELFSPFEAKNFQEDDDLVLLKGEATRFENRICQRGTGEILTLKIERVPMFDGQGFPLYTIACIEDITEYQSSLFLTHLFRSAIDTAADNIFIFDAVTHRFLDVNANVYSDLGYSSEEIRKMTPFDIKPFLQREVLENFINAAIIGERPVFETFHRRRDGSVFPVQVRLHYYEEKDTRCVVAVARDTTETLKAHLEFKEQEKRYRELFETMHRGVVYQEKSGKIIAMNPAAEKILGRTFREVVGVTSEGRYWQSVDADGVFLPAERHPSMIALHTGEPVNDTIMGIRNPKTNSRVWINVNAVPQFNDGDSEPHQVFTVFDDVTLQKNTEEELRRTIEEKRKLFGVIAHDIRNPLNVLLNYSEHLYKSIPAEQYKEWNDIAKTMLETSTNLHKLVESLFEWAKAHHQAKKFLPRKYPLLDVLHNATDTVMPSATLKNIAIMEEIDANTYVFCDYDMATIILRNIIGNAVKFTPKGGKITVSSSTNEDGECVIAIRDNGIGMPHHIKENLFVADAKVSRTGTEGEFGTGFGLLICNDYIKVHGGRIEVQSEEDEGTEFRCYFPQP